MTDSSNAPIRDLLLGEMIDFSPKDSSDMMQRPFFSLSKRTRLKPIEYQSPDKTVQVRVTANQAYGMATIWDADILIWVISKIVARRNRGTNDSSGVVRTTVSDLLTGIGRGVGGKDYKEVMAAINRLRTTQVETNIRSGQRRWAAFHYLGDVEGVGPNTEGADLTTLTLRIPDWLLDGIENDQIVTIDKEYFGLTSGIERAIYRMARKHAGSQADGWTCRISLLHEKTGSEAELKRFAFEMRKLVNNDSLPRYAMTLTTTKAGEPAIHFVDRAHLAKADADARQEKRLRQHRDDARTKWIDAGKAPAGFDRAWQSWLDRGFASNEFSPQGRLL